MALHKRSKTSREAPPIKRARQTAERWDKYIYCNQCAKSHWGAGGAAGLLLVRRDENTLRNTATHVVLQLRSATVQNPDTWAIPGGALDFGETPQQAAIREGMEETSLPASCLEGENPLIIVREEVALTQHQATPTNLWKYTTFIADIRGEFEPSIPKGDHESTAVEWVAIDEVDDGSRVLHPGFADGWKTLREMILRQDRPTVRELTAEEDDDVYEAEEPEERDEEEEC